MGLNIKVNLNMQSILNKAANPTVMKYAHARLWAFCDPYVPMDSGMLASNVTPSEKYLVYKSPYAARMYTGDSYNFRKDKHQKATSRWNKAMMAEKGDLFAEDITNAIKQGESFMNTAYNQACSEMERQYQKALEKINA